MIGWLCIWGFSLMKLMAQEGNIQFEGLPGEGADWKGAINVICQDHQGFIWLGTWSGLLRYDGYEFTIFQQQSDSGGLGSNKVTSVYEDQQNRLWVGTRRGGVQQFDRATQQFESFSHDPTLPGSLSNNNVWCIYQDRQGRLWVGTEEGLNYFDEERGTFRTFWQRPGGLSHDFIYNLAETSDGSLWVATENGLNRILWPPEEDNPRIYSYSLAPDQGLESVPASLHNYIFSLKTSLRDSMKVWVGTKNGLKQVTADAAYLEKVEVQEVATTNGLGLTLSHNFVLSLLEEPEQPYLWVGTYQGLNRIRLDTPAINTFYANSESSTAIKSSLVRALAFDRNHQMWIGTEKGISLYDLNPNPFRTWVIPGHQAAKNSASITGLAMAPDSQFLWIATYGAGFSRLNWESYLAGRPELESYLLQTTETEPKLDFLSDLIFDSRGDPWMISQGGGLIHVKEQDLERGVQGGLLWNFEQFHTKTEPALIDNYVMSIDMDRSGIFWLGMWNGGLDRFDPIRKEVLHFTSLDQGKIDLQEFANVKIATAVKDGEEFLLVGTRGNGVLVLSYDELAKQLKLVDHFQAKEGQLTNGFVNSILVEGDMVWIGTEFGLNAYDMETKEFIQIHPKGKAAHNLIQSVIRGDDGLLWISTQDGLMSMQGSAEEPVFQFYYEEDGLQSNFFYVDADEKAPGGVLVFGDTKGLCSLDPKQIKVDAIPPEVAIVDFRLFNESMSPGETYEGRTILQKAIGETGFLELSHRDQVISFEFVGLHFDQPGKHQYAYKLQGFDEDWIYTEADQRIAHYTNLPYREYTFMVKAANGDGVWSETPAILRLRLTPPFWLTPLAYGLYGLLFIGLLLGVRQLTLIRVNLRNRWQVERMEREKLEAVNRVKQQFFTNISHELRTPLTLLISPLEQLIQERSGDSRLREILLRMHRNAHRLFNLINQLLDMRRAEAGQTRLQVAEGNLVKFTHEVVRSFDSLARDRSIHLEYAPDQPELKVWFDRDQMEKILFNLLSNALKFTPEQGQVRVRTYLLAEEQKACISVSDTGRGIPAHKLGLVFDRFYQVEEEEMAESAYPGSGIGLSLAKSLVELHHGEIEVDSQVGKGTTFRVFMLMGDQHFEEAEKISGFKDSEHALHYIPAENQEGTKAEEPIPASASAEDPKPAEHRYTLLIVEDNEDIRNYLSDMLSPQYEVIEAENGQQALELAQSDAPDLVLSDIAMPEMDGIELCRQLKTDVSTSHIPVILLTARTSLIYKLDGYDTGADDYVTKPFNLQLLEARIRNLIRIRQQLKRRFSHGIDLSPSEVAVTSLDEKFMQQVMGIVEDHMDDFEFSVEQLSKEVGMSRMQLYRKLKALTGKSPNQVLRTIRMKRAAQLLKTGQYNVSEVTYMVGFQDLKYFRERFKEEFGVSPSGYEG